MLYCCRRDGVGAQTDGGGGEPAGDLEPAAATTHRHPGRHRRLHAVALRHRDRDGTAATQETP